MNRRSFLQMALSLSLGSGAASRSQGATPRAPTPPANDAGFVPLRVRTAYSAGRSLVFPGALARTASELGIVAVGMADVGNLFGAPWFYRACRERDVKPILGCELRVHRGRETECACELTLLAMDSGGYSRLCRLLGTAGRPDLRRATRVDRRALERFGDGLIAILVAVDGCPPAGREGENTEPARRWIEDLATVFRDRFYLGICTGAETPSHAPPPWVREAFRLGVPLVATPECRFLEPTEAAACETLRRITYGTSSGSAEPPSSEASGAWLRSPAGMQAIFAAHPDAVANTLAIATRCNVTFGPGRRALAISPPFPGENPHALLMVKAAAGLEERLGHRRTAARNAEASRSGGETETYRERLSSELAVIEQKECASVLLVTADAVRWMKQRGITVGPGRGTLAGSLVAWALGITEVDPLEHGLCFERFLNPLRDRGPDINVDCCADRRPELIAYLTETHGRDRVAACAAVTTWKGPALVRAVATAVRGKRAARRIAAAWPRPAHGRPPRIAVARDHSPRLQALCLRDPAANEILEHAEPLEDLPREVFPHASSVVLSPRPLTDDFPLFDDPGGTLVAQCESEDAVVHGLQMFDFLPSRDMTLLGRALRRLDERNEPLDLSTIPLDDQAAWDLLAHGDLPDIAMFAGCGTRRNLLRRVAPRSILDLACVIALDRPGFLDADFVDTFADARHGRRVVDHPHPLLTPILRDTHGLLLFQEQTISIIQAVTGATLAEADLIRLEMIRHPAAARAPERATFSERAASRGFSLHEAAGIFDWTADANTCAFSKAHAIATALAVYGLAWLRAGRS